jgi:DNA gyrase inhibitor GyrI
MAKWGRWLAIGGVAAVAASAYLYARREARAAQPGYRVVERAGAIEIRDYPALLVAQSEDPGDRKSSLDRGFRKLARYIFAKSREGEKIAMTAPVLHDAAAPGRWRTRFIMPAGYRRDTLPAPAAGVDIADVPARRVAAIRFNGRVDDAALTRREADLRAWLAARGLSGGAAEYAFYNSPFVAAAMRRNEVLIPLAG